MVDPGSNVLDALIRDHPGRDTFRAREPVGSEAMVTVDHLPAPGIMGVPTDEDRGQGIGTTPTEDADHPEHPAAVFRMAHLLVGLEAGDPIEWEAGDGKVVHASIIIDVGPDIVGIV